jgi:hypothetical protein
MFNISGAKVSFLEVLHGSLPLFSKFTIVLYNVLNKKMVTELEV